jgi:capsular polysaccharide biosynthesis protein
MENLQYSKIFRKNWEIVALFIGVTVVLALIISLLQPFQYEASTKILVIQKQEKNLDAYTATKSAERIGKNLSSIIFTSSFYNEVLEADKALADKFPQDNIERRKAWEKNIKADVIPETGILEVNVYDVDRQYAAKLVKTISYVLMNKGSEYHGGGSDVELKIVDDVFLSKYPVRPNIILNTSLALVLGFLLGSAFIILSEAEKQKKEVEKVANNQPSLFEDMKKQAQDNDDSENEIKETEEEAESEAKNSEIDTPAWQFAKEKIDEPKTNRTDQTEIKTMYDHIG